MKKSIVFIAFCMILLLSFGCGASSQNGDSDKDKQKNNVINMPADMPFMSYLNPNLVGDNMFVCVGESQATVSKVVDYNIESKKYDVLFESEYGEASVSNTMANNNWVIWVDSDISGKYNILYGFNRKSEAIYKIADYEAAADDYVIIAPWLSGDYVAWIGPEKDGKSIVKLFNLESMKSTDVATLRDHSFYNNFVYFDDSKLLWTDNVNGKGYFFIYDVESYDTKQIEAPYPYPGYAQMSDGLIFSINFEDYHNWSDQSFGCFDISSSSYTPVETNTAYINQFRINDTTLAIMDGNNKLHLIEVGTNEKLENTSPLDTVDTIDISEDGRVVVGVRATENENPKLAIIDVGK